MQAMRMILTTLSLPALWLPVFAASDGDQKTYNETNCEEAYRRGCWKFPPFKGCCRECQSAHDEITCHWAIHQACCGDLNGSFTVESKQTPLGGPSQCEIACEALANTTLEVQDFCPGSYLLDVLDKCPPAKKSWQKAFEKYRGLCEYNAVASCSWSASWGEENMTGHFNFSPTESTCFDVCTELGGEGMGITHSQQCKHCKIFQEMSESKCPSGFKSFSNQSDQGMADARRLCGPDSLCGHTVTGVVRSNVKVANSPVATQGLQEADVCYEGIDCEDCAGLDDYCYKAFEDGCWKSESFSHCCQEDCTGGHHKPEGHCKWNFYYKWGHGDHDVHELNGRVDLITKKDDDCSCSCLKACKLLGDPKKQPLLVLRRQLPGALDRCPGSLPGCIQLG